MRPKMVALTHDHPRAVHIEIIAEAVAKQRHGLDLVHVRDGE